MCRLLVDAMVWNYIGKAKVVPGFLSSLPAIPATLAEVIEQLRPALGKWPELRVIIRAVENDEIEDVELDQEEEELRIALLGQFPGLGVVDCGLLSVASRREWTLLTCDQALRKVASRMGTRTADVGELLNEAVQGDHLSSCDRDRVLEYSRGRIGHRDDC